MLAVHLDLAAARTEMSRIIVFTFFLPFGFPFGFPDFPFLNLRVDGRLAVADLVVVGPLAFSLPLPLPAPLAPGFLMRFVIV